MGGCASRPKESDNHAPAEAPTSPKQPEAQDPVVAQEESQNEAPLVDVSEPKDGETAIEATAGDAEAVPQEAAEAVTVDTAEAAVAELLEAKEEATPEESKTEDSVPAETTEVKTDEPVVVAA